MFKSGAKHHNPNPITTIKTL